MPGDRNEPRLRKSLGQHHLRHPELCRPAVTFLQLQGHRVFEIGPGGGVLTAELLAAGGRVVGWELDLAWAFALRRRVPSTSVSLVAGDALDLPWEALGERDLVAGNLPYGVATVIVADFLTRALASPRAVFLVQDEVADRLVASPGSSSYGLMSVLVEAWSRATVLCRLKPGSFRPVPKVGGAFVGLLRRTPPLPIAEMKTFRDTLAAAFRQRRKTLANSLRSAWGRERAETVLAESGLDGARRAQSLHLEDFARLHQAFVALGGDA